MDNKGTFSLHSDQYAKHRPQYPKEIFAYLSSLTPRHDRAWDCGTGNGQAALLCAEYYSQVEATDISAQQIQNAIRRPGITYSVSPAEKTNFAAGIFDLVIVAEALHWFNFDDFYAEVRRVLKHNGVLAALGYASLSIDPPIDQIIKTDLFEPIDTYWSQGNRELFAAYKNIPFPFDEIEAPRSFKIELMWDLHELGKFLRTWSAVKRFEAEQGIDPVKNLEVKLRDIWGGVHNSKLVTMPLFLRVGIISKSDHSP